jgi:hypothetical protein
MRVGGGIKEDRPHIETAVVLVVEIVDITAQDKGAPIITTAAFAAAGQPPSHVRPLLVYLMRTAWTPRVPQSGIGLRYS